FYHVAADRRFPYRLYGAQQDRYSMAVASRGETWSGVISESDTYRVGPGEAGNVAPDPRDADTGYSNNEKPLVPHDRKRNVTQDISIVPRDVSGKSAGELEHRFGWTEPLFLSPHDPDVLYTASEVVWRSADRGQTWRAISGDLTRNDRGKQRPSGGPITLDITSVEYYDTVFALAESPLEKGLLWAGTDDGLIHVTRDGGRSWRNVTPRALPAWSLVSMIEPSRFAAGAAYVAVDRHKLDDFRPYVYRTTDLGASWTASAGDLPVGAYVHAVREDP